MKSLRNKVILSGIVLMFAFIATIGSTYAWFTVSSSTEIETIQLNVTAADNLLLRARTGGAEETLIYLQNAENYSTYIDIDELVAAGYLYDDPVTRLVPHRLQPSTVLGDHEGGAVLQYLPNITNRNYAPAMVNDNNGQYIMLQFWLLSQSEDPQEIQLSSFVIDALAGGLGNTGSQQQVMNAVRIGVVLDDAMWGGTGAAGRGELFLFGNDPDYDFEFFEGDTGYSATPADNIRPTNYEDFTVYSTASAAGDLYTVNFNIPTLVTVYIFIEGWDADASNEIILAAFNVSFGFKYAE